MSPSFRLLRAEARPASRRRRGTPPCRRRRASRAELAGDPLEALGGAGEVGAPQVARAGSRAVRGVRDADPLLEQGELLVPARRGETSAARHGAGARSRCAGSRSARGPRRTRDPGLMPTKTMRRSGARTSGTSLGVASGSAMSCALSHVFPHGGSEAPFANGRRRAVTRMSQLRAGSRAGRYAASAAASAASSSAIRSSVRRLDARLEVPPQILARDGELVPGRRGSILTEGHRRIPAAVQADIALRLRQRTQPPHVAQATTPPGRSRASETMGPWQRRSCGMRSSLTAAGGLTDENGVGLDVPAGVVARALLLAALLRCSLKSLRLPRRTRRSRCRARLPPAAGPS